MGNTETSLGTDKAELERRRGAIADAWKLASPAATAAVWRRGRYRRNTGEYSDHI